MVLEHKNKDFEHVLSAVWFNLGPLHGPQSRTTIVVIMISNPRKLDRLT